MSLLRDIPKRVQQEELAISHWNGFLIRVVRKAVICRGCGHFLSFSNDEMQRTAWNIMPEKAFHMGTDHSDFRVEQYCVVLCCAVSSGRGEKAVARASLGKEIEMLGASQAIRVLPKIRSETLYCYLIFPPPSVRCGNFPLLFNNQKYLLPCDFMWFLRLEKVASF